MLRRAFALIARPRREWAAIAGEPVHPLRILVGYVLPLSAVPAVAWMIGLHLFGLELVVEGEPVMHPAAPAILRAGATTFLGSLASVAILALAFRALAPMYGAGRDLRRAWSVAAYGSTPLWLYGALLVKPMLVIGSIGAVLHCGYLYYAGLQALGLVREVDAAEYVAIGLFLLLVASTFAGGLLASFNLV
jgi:hypothetical protein